MTVYRLSVHGIAEPALNPRQKSLILELITLTRPSLLFSILMDLRSVTQAAESARMGKSAQHREYSNVHRERALAGRSLLGFRPTDSWAGVRLLVLVTGLLALVSGWSYAQGTSVPGTGAKAQAAKLYIEQGKDNLGKKRFSVALRSFSAAILADPSAAEAYLMRGAVYDQSGLPQKALQDIAKYIELRPSDPAGYLKRGDIRSFNQDYEAALADYSAAVKLAPKSMKAYVGRGLVRTALEQYDDAIKDYQWALTLEPENGEALSNMGVACMMAGRSLEAVSYFERALKREKDPQWRNRIEKWIDELVKTPEGGEKVRAGPVRTPSDRSGPLW